jgi:hypothetical protein
MSTKSVRNFVSEVRSEPEELALALIAADSSAVQIFVQILERHLTMDPLSRIERVWQISASQTAAMFGVSRQAYSKWHLSGVPAERREDVSDMDVATDELLTYVKSDRIPAVVRRKASRFDNMNLLEIAEHRGTSEVLKAVRETFDLSRVQP